MTNTPQTALIVQRRLFASVLTVAILLVAAVPVSAQDGGKPASEESSAKSEPKKADPKPAKEKVANPPSNAKAAEPKKSPANPKQTAEQKKQAAVKKSENTSPASDKKMEGNSKPSADKKADAKPKATPPAPATEDPAVVKEWVSKGVWLSPPTEGPAASDFKLMGEYVGKVKSGNEKGKPLGVQIRTLGDGEFEARAYQGGLPGQDGFTEDKMMVLVGKRSGETLVLSGGPWAMFAGPDQCKIINVEGKTLGELPRADRTSPTLRANAPEGAMVLFDGTGTKAFATGEMTPHGLLRQGADINFMLSDFDLHVEFRIPHMPKYTEQARGNSGLYLQSRYECQVLDSFGAPRVFNGLGALYRHRAADVNMAFPPLAWQTYDVHFTAARFAANGKKLRNAEVTSWINGVKVQDKQSLPGPTGAGQDESPTLLPTKLQNHKDPVRYRNIWVIDRGLTGGIEFPQMVESE